MYSKQFNISNNFKTEYIFMYEYRSPELSFSVLSRRACNFSWVAPWMAGSAKATADSTTCTACDVRNKSLTIFDLQDLQVCFNGVLIFSVFMCLIFSWELGGIRLYFSQPHQLNQLDQNGTCIAIRRKLQKALSLTRTVPTCWTCPSFTTGLQPLTSVSSMEASQRIPQFASSRLFNAHGPTSHGLLCSRKYCVMGSKRIE